MNETNNTTNNKKEFFFFRSGSVFELIAKCAVMLLIPYALLFLLGIILDKGLDVVAGSDFWPIAIFALISHLELAALVLSVIAVVKFCKARGKTKDALNSRKPKEPTEEKAAADAGGNDETEKQGEDKGC